MPPHTATVLTPQRRRFGLVAALAATCAAAGAATIVSADNQPASQFHTIAAPVQPATSRYFDIEANKAGSMRALGLRIAQQEGTGSSRYEDIEANKARSQRAR
jgi:hypothetical protein